MKLFPLVQVCLIFLLVCYSSSQETEKPPECLNMKEVALMIVYPDSAKLYDIEGKVTIKVLVGLEGEVIKTGTITGPKVFYKEIKRVSTYLKFTPAIYESEKVKCWVTVPFLFKLKKDEEDEK